MWKGCKYSSGFGLLPSAQLSVTEAYYRTRASAAGGQQGRRAEHTRGGQVPRHRRRVPARISGCEAGGGWLRHAPRTRLGRELSRAGEGRKEGRAVLHRIWGGRAWKRCSFRLVSPAVRSRSSGRLLPVTARRFQRRPLEPPACRLTCFLSPKLQGQSP